MATISVLVMSLILRLAMFCSRSKGKRTIHVTIEAVAMDSILVWKDTDDGDLANASSIRPNSRLELKASGKNNQYLDSTGKSEGVTSWVVSFAGGKRALSKTMGGLKRS